MIGLTQARTWLAAAALSAAVAVDRPAFACPAPHQWLTLRGWSRDGQAFLCHGDSTERGAFIEARDEKGELLLDVDTPHSELESWDRKLRITGRISHGPKSPDGRWRITAAGTQLLVLRLHDLRDDRRYIVDVVWDATEETRYRVELEQVVWRDDSAAFAVRARSMGTPDEPCYDDESRMPEGDASYDRLINGTPQAVVARWEWIRRFFVKDPSLGTPLPDTLDPLLMVAAAVDLLGPEAPRILGRAMSSDSRPWFLNEFDPVYLQALLPVMRVELRGLGPPAGLRTFLEDLAPGRAVVFTRGMPDRPAPKEVRVLHPPRNDKVAHRVAEWLGARDPAAPTPPAPVAPMRRLEVEAFRVGDELVPDFVLTGPPSALRIDWGEIGDTVRRVSDALAAIAVRDAATRPTMPAPTARPPAPPEPRDRRPAAPPTQAERGSAPPPATPVTATP
ncbi:MAG: hypothetical protein AMXMBFR64_51320 [Myxococcales bacterium]